MTYLAPPYNKAPSFNESFSDLLNHVRNRANYEKVYNLQRYAGRFEFAFNAIANYANQKRSICDLGCGFGAMLYLSTHLGFEHLTGVDKFTNKELSYISHIKEYSFYEADFNRFPMVPFIDDNTFDVVISSQTFEHLLNHPMGYLNEAWRILRYGGLLVFDVPNPCTLMKAIQVLQGNTISWGTREFARTAKLENGHIQPAWDVHYMEYSPSDIKSLLDDLKDSKVMHHKTVGTRPSDADSFLNRAIRWSLSKTGLMDQRLLGNVQCWSICKEIR